MLWMACPCSLMVYGVATDCSSSLTIICVLGITGACKRVASDLGLGDGFL